MRTAYCSLRGGLGNQMFQLAIGLSMAQRHNAELVLDDGWFRGRRHRSETLRQFCLPYFKLHYRLPSRRERLWLAFMDFALKLQKRIRWRLLPIHFDRLPLSERRLCREPWVVVQGDWQDFTLVAPMRTQLQQLLCFRDGLFSKEHQNQVASIAAEPLSVAVHVRRGDYVFNSNAAAVHGVCSLDYYEKALTAVRQKLGVPHVYLFSDDLDWAQRELPLQGVKVTAVDSSQLEIPSLADLADFDLMRHCNHAVIANSSFSWWAAFLLQTPESLVIAPRQWFVEGSSAQIYDPHWLLM